MAQPILFIHGMFAHGGVFDAWVPYFEEAGFECHAPSLPGRKPEDRELLGRLTMADELDALLAYAGKLREPPIIIGHSMGGLLGQQLAAKKPCAALVLLGSSPPGVLWAHPRALPHLFQLMPTIAMGRALRPSDPTLRAVVFNALPAKEATKLCSEIVTDSGRAFRSQVFGTQHLPRAAVKCPVLVMSGAKDINGSRGIQRRLAKRYDAKHHLVADCDHWIVAPSRVSRTCPRILEWLRELELAPDRQPRHAHA